MGLTPAKVTQLDIAEGKVREARGRYAEIEDMRDEMARKLGEAERKAVDDENAAIEVFCKTISEVTGIEVKPARRAQVPAK